MTAERYCRICGGRADDVLGWVDLDDLGRLWLCDTHRAGAAFHRLNWGAHIYSQQGVPGGFLVIGPYPYGRSG